MHDRELDWITYWRLVGRNKWVNLQVGALAAIASSPCSISFILIGRICERIWTDRSLFYLLSWKDLWEELIWSCARSGSFVNWAFIGIRVRSQCHFGSRSDPPWSIISFGPIPQPPSVGSGGIFRFALKGSVSWFCLRMFISFVKLIYFICEADLFLWFQLSWSSSVIDASRSRSELDR